jgi:FKBP-type peptidyl-prolyl cis-trans isomerase SlyD
MSVIQKGDFVRISYTAKLEDGTVIDSTDEEVAKEHGVYEEHARYGDIIVVVGEGHVIKGLDEALEGKEVGFKGSVEVPPEKAFGEYDPEKKEVISISRFKERPEPGTRVRVGERVGIVERVIGRRAVVDFNHPLAGKTITFDFEIKEKIESPEERIKSIFMIHTGREVSVELDGKKAVIEIPRGLSLDQAFMLGKYAAVNDIFRLTDVEEIDLVEKFEKKAEPAETVEAAEASRPSDETRESETEAAGEEVAGEGEEAGEVQVEEKEVKEEVKEEDSGEEKENKTE